ncbi:MAG: phosphate regulon sensor histidine kinase PhoR [Xanthomonadales bacterium]|nr:phosphate regulon sensor histidine kinase PhoR [Xanthomonadales bacterium]
MPARSWNAHLARFIAGLALVLLIAWFSGAWLSVLALSAAAYAAWQVYNNWRLHQWLADSQREPPESLGIWSDIFDQIVRLEKQNQRHRQRQKETIQEFMSVTNAFPDASLVIDDQDNIKWFNDAARALLGLEVASDLGQAVTNLVRDPDFADWLAVQDRVSSKLEMPCPHNPNQQLLVSAVKYGDGQRLIILRDITDIHNLERVRRDFVANVSHELRTPLTVLLGYLESIQGQCPDELLPAIERMQGQAVQMSALLNDLLELSRLQSDEHSSPDEDVDVPAMLAQLRELADELSQGKHELVFEVDPELYLRGIPTDLESAFRNLIQNAVTYTPRKGRITVRWSATEKGPELTVTDTGPGIPKKDIPRLTERFYRVGSDRSRKGGGTGLGLSIVKHVLNAHAAKLSISSELGAGSTFTCQFPFERAVGAPAPGNPQE